MHGIAVRPDQDELLAWINEFVETIKANGELNAIHQKWLGSDCPNCPRSICQVLTGLEAQARQPKRAAFAARRFHPTRSRRGAPDGQGLRHHADHAVPHVRTPEIMIRMEGVHKWYGEFHVLKNIDLDVAHAASGSSSAAPRAPANRR